MSKEPLTKELVEKMYKDGISIRKIGKQLGYSDRTVRSFMVENDIKFKSKNIDKIDKNIEEEIKKLYLNGLNPREIGEIVNLSQSKIKSFLISNDLWVSKEVLTKEELVHLYRIEKLTIREIAELKNCSTKKVEIALKKFKIKKLQYKFNFNELQMLYCKYKIKIKDIAEMKNTTEWFVKKALIEYNLL